MKTEVGDLRRISSVLGTYLLPSEASRPLTLVSLNSLGLQWKVSYDVCGNNSRLSIPRVCTILCRKFVSDFFLTDNPPLPPLTGVQQISISLDGTLGVSAVELEIRGTRDADHVPSGGRARDAVDDAFEVDGDSGASAESYPTGEPVATAGDVHLAAALARIPGSRDGGAVVGRCRGHATIAHDIAHFLSSLRGPAGRRADASRELGECRWQHQEPTGDEEE